MYVLMKALCCSESGNENQPNFHIKCENFNYKFIWWIGGLGCSTSYIWGKDIQRPGFSESDDIGPTRLEEPPSLKGNKLYLKSTNKPYLT